MNAYRIEHVQGYAAADHFTAEVARRCTGPHASLAAARAALKAAKAGHRHTAPLGRLDIVRTPDMRRFTWE